MILTSTEPNILGCCFPSKIKIYDVVSLPVPFVGHKTRALHEILTQLKIFGSVDVKITPYFCSSHIDVSYLGREV